MRDLYNSQIGFRAAIYGLHRYSTPVRALNIVHARTCTLVRTFIYCELSNAANAEKLVF